VVGVFASLSRIPALPLLLYCIISRLVSRRVLCDSSRSPLEWCLAVSSGALLDACGVGYSTLKSSLSVPHANIPAELFSMRPDDRWSVEDGQHVPMEHLFRLHQQPPPSSQPHKSDFKRKRTVQLDSGSGERAVGAASLLADLEDAENKMALHDATQRYLHVPEGETCSAESCGRKGFAAC